MFPSLLLLHYIAYHCFTDMSHDPQPAVVTQDGKVLVYATDKHRQSDAAKHLCIQYEPVPLPDNKVPQIKKKKPGPPSGWTVLNPHEVNTNSEASAPASPVHHIVDAANPQTPKDGCSKCPGPQP